MEPTAPVRPDFALEAMRLLSGGRAESALELAANGVRSYPTYLGGYAVLADCYAALGHRDDAHVILNEADRRFPDRQTIRERRERLVQPVRSTPPPAEPEAAEPQHVEQAPVPDERQLTGDAPEAREEPVPSVQLVPKRRRRAPVIPERKDSPLRVIELGGAPSDTRMIRSSAMRLIPGLEFTSLRFEGQRRSGRSINTLPKPPEFRSFNKPSPNAYSKAQPDTPRRVSLEELADRIGKVRMTADELEKKPPAPDPLAEAPRRSLVTETLANIYLQQENFDKAISAYTQLRDANPDKEEHFQAQIDKATALRDSAS